MTEWTSLELGRALQHLFDHRGRTPKKLGSEFTSAGVQVISAKLVSGGRLNLDRERRFVTPGIYERWMPVKLAEGDVLLTSEAPLGEAALVPSSSSLCLGQRLFALRADPGVLDNRFLYYWLRSPAGRAALAERSSGTTVLGIRQAELVQVVIRAPDVRLQRAIGGLLASLDDLIENNRRRVEVLEEMARAIYREWFVRFRYPGHEDVPLVDSPLGPIPEGWKVCSLGEISTNHDRLRRPLSRSQRQKRSGSFPYYGAAKLIDWVDGWIIDGEYLLFAEDGSVQTSEGYPVLQLVQGKFWANNHTHILEGDGVSTRFLYLASALVPISGYVTGAAQPKITQANLNRIPLVVGPAEIQSAFDAVIDPVLDEWRLLQQANAPLASLRDLLLPKLVTGQIDVSHLDLDALTGAATA